MKRSREEEEQFFIVFFSSRRRHTRYWRDWSSDVCTSDLAEERCRALAGGRVRLTASGRRRAVADLAFVRCLDVLMSGAGRPGVGTTDPRLVAIAGERAAWNDRAPDSWEYVMPWQVRSEQQRRLVAGGDPGGGGLRSGPANPRPRPPAGPRVVRGGPGAPASAPPTRGWSPSPASVPPGTTEHPTAGSTSCRGRSAASSNAGWSPAGTGCGWSCARVRPPPASAVRRAGRERGGGRPLRPGDHRRREDRGGTAVRPGPPRRTRGDRRVRAAPRAGEIGRAHV